MSTQKSKLSLPGRKTWRGGILLICFFLTACQSDPTNPSWNITFAKAEIDRLIHEGEKMMVLGKEGKLEEMASVARRIKNISKETQKAIPPTLSEGNHSIRHLKVVLDEIESVIVHSRKGHKEDCLLHGERALGRIKKAKEHMDKL
jgi:hypothetical protein